MFIVSYLNCFIKLPIMRRPAACDNRASAKKHIWKKSEKRLQTSFCPSEDKRMDIMRALIGVYCFKVAHVTHHLKIF